MSIVNVGWGWWRKIGAIFCQAIEEVQQHAQGVAFWTKLVGANQGWVERGDVGFGHVLGHSLGQQVGRTPFVPPRGIGSERLWQGRPRAQIRPDKQRL